MHLKGPVHYYLLQIANSILLLLSDFKKCTLTAQLLESTLPNVRWDELTKKGPAERPGRMNNGNLVSTGLYSVCKRLIHDRVTKIPTASHHEKFTQRY